MPSSVLEKIKEIQLKDRDVGYLDPNEYGRQRVIWNDMCYYLQIIKTSIDDELNNHSVVKELKELDIVREIFDLRSENKELYNKISMLQTLIKDKDEKTKIEIQHLQLEIKSLVVIMHEIYEESKVVTKKNN